MIKRTIAIILELIPIISAAVSFILLKLPVDADLTRRILLVTFLLAFLGFVCFFIGRNLAKGDKTVRLLGILDWLATISVIAFYVLVFLSLGA